MNWENFSAIKNVLVKYNIKSILGVVPENKDPHLNVSSYYSGFFQSIRDCADYGDSIAQHGTIPLHFMFLWDPQSK